MFQILFFSFCCFAAHATNYSNQNFTNRNQYDANHGGVFKNCLFTGCTEVDGYVGGALFDLCAGNLIVDCCSFTACRSIASGGAILCDSVTTFIVPNGSTFSGCSAYFGSGGIEADYISSCFYIHNCRVSECYAPFQGCGITVDSAPFIPAGSSCTAYQSEFAGVILRDIEILNCGDLTKTQEGGGLCLDYIKSGFLFSNLKIAWCSAAKGGGVYFTFWSGLPVCAVGFQYSHFQNN